MARKVNPQRSKKTYADIVFDRPLEDLDDLADKLANLEQARQNNKLIMIASESQCPRPVREALTSTFTNLYAEGYPRTKMLHEERCAIHDIDRQLMLHRRYQDRRYYKGCDYVNLVEALAQQRVARLFATKKMPAEHIYANVQPHSGASANNAIYEAFLKPGDTVMGMSLASGGHLTHGSKVNRSGKHYNIVSYTVDVETGKMDFDEIRRLALENKARMIIAGYSAYPHDVDWKKFREIADEVGDCIVLADVSHTAGLISAGVMSNPIDHAQVVMFTTHKTLCGPRGAVILTTDYDVARKIDSAVFPGEQSGAHLNNVLAKAVSFQIAEKKQFKEMMRQVVRNSKALAAELKRLGLNIAYKDTDSHMVLVNLREMRSGGYMLNGETASRILDLCGITCNKNQIAGDENAVHPSAVRFGTTWITQRGLRENHMKRIAKVIHTVLKGIIPFDYIGGARNIGRGKILFETIMKARREVCEIAWEMEREGGFMDLDYPHFCGGPPPIVRKTPFKEQYEKLGAKFMRNDGWIVPKEVTSWRREIRELSKSALLVDSTDIPALGIEGERARDFLQQILTSNVYDLEERNGLESLMLAPDGHVMASVCLFRPKDLDGCGPRFLLTSSIGIPEEVKDWLITLSDGYVRFDMDVFMKIEGPVLIEDRWRGDEAWAAFDIYGHNARKICEKAAGKTLPRKSAMWIEQVKENGGRLYVLKMGQNGFERFRICGSERTVSSVFEKLVSLKNAPAVGGYLARKSLSARAGLPIGRPDTVKASKVQRKRPDLFDMEKPYFIGAESLEYKEEIHPVSVPKIKLKEKKSYLIDEHRRLYPSASIQSFAGWEMPVVFESIREEHNAVRTAAGLFDLSHMGIFEISGPYAARFLDLVTSNYIRALRPGQSHYSYILDPSGEVLDDVFVYHVEPEKFILVANAINADKIEKWLNDVNKEKVHLTLGGRPISLEGMAKIRNLKVSRVKGDMKIIIAIQGPKSRQILAQSLGKDSSRLFRMRKFEMESFAMKGIQCFISRTGYTGEEYGYEIFVHPGKAVKVWNILMKIGSPEGLKPAGLGARDSTRTEAGFPLWGNELAGPDRISPIEAGYGTFAKLHKPFFIGREEMVRDVLNRNREVVRFKIDRKGSRIVRRGDIVADKFGAVLGQVTSNVVVGTTQVGMVLVGFRSTVPGDLVNFGLARNMSPEDLEDMKKNKQLPTTIRVEQGEVLTRFPPKPGETAPQAPPAMS